MSLTYDPTTGTLSRDGKTLPPQRFVRFDGQSRPAARVAWILHHGRDPVGYVVCLDGNLPNLRLENLALRSRSQMRLTQRTPAKNTSGVKGVSWSRRRGKWMAHITYRGSKLNLGYFRDIGEADRTVQNKRTELTNL